jgi:hypothetical protein
MNTKEISLEDELPPIVNIDENTVEPFRSEDGENGGDTYSEHNQSENSSSI